MQPLSRSLSSRNRRVRGGQASVSLAANPGAIGPPDLDAGSPPPVRGSNRIVGLSNSTVNDSLVLGFKSAGAWPCLAPSSRAAIDPVPWLFDGRVRGLPLRPAAPVPRTRFFRDPGPAAGLSGPANVPKHRETIAFDTDVP